MNISYSFIRLRLSPKIHSMMAKLNILMIRAIGLRLTVAYIQ